MLQKHELGVQIDALAQFLYVQNHDLCVLDAMTRSGYNNNLHIIFCKNVNK